MILSTLMAIIDSDTIVSAYITEDYIGTFTVDDYLNGDCALSDCGVYDVGGIVATGENTIDVYLY